MSDLSDFIEAYCKAKNLNLSDDFCNTYFNEENFKYIAQHNIDKISYKLEVDDKEVFILEPRFYDLSLNFLPKNMIDYIKDTSYVLVEKIHRSYYNPFNGKTLQRSPIISAKLISNDKNINVSHFYLILKSQIKDFLKEMSESGYGPKPTKEVINILSKEIS